MSFSNVENFERTMRRIIGNMDRKIIVETSWQIGRKIWAFWSQILHHSQKKIDNPQILHILRRVFPFLNLTKLITALNYSVQKNEE